MEIKEIIERINETHNEVKSLLDKQDAEIKKNGESSADTAKKLDKASERIDEFKAELAEAKKRIDEMEAKGNRMHQDHVESKKSLGERFIGSEEYKNWDFNGKSGRYNVNSFHTKDTITGASLGDVPGYLYSPDRVTEKIKGPDRMMRVRDLIPVIPTTSGAIEFVRETGFTNNAAAVAEGATKPESAIQFEIVSTSVKTIAHWLPATRQIISDDTQLKGYIDNRLIYGLKLEEDRQILYGDGQGSNLQGILTDSDVQAYDQDSSDTKVDAIRRAMTRALVAEYPISGTVIHPNDWEDIELLKGSDNHYIWVTVTVGGEQRLWRAPVIVTTAISEGDFLTGAFELGTSLWDREDAAIRVSDSHEEYFTKNLWAILAEERITQTIYRPEAFVVGTFTDKPSES